MAKRAFHPVWTVTNERALGPDNTFFRVRAQNLDGAVVISMRPKQFSKAREGLVALDLENGSVRWGHPLRRRNISINQALGGPGQIFITTGYSGDSEDTHYPSFPYALDARTGSVRWKYRLASSDEDGAYDEETDVMYGTLGSVLFVRMNNWKNAGIDTTSGTRIWLDAESGGRRARSHVFERAGDMAVLQTRERRLGWYRADGTRIREVRFGFPKRGEGYIDGIWPDEERGTFYVSVYGSRYRSGDLRDDSFEWEHCLLYEVSGDGKRQRLVGETKGRCESVIRMPEGIFASSEDRTLVFSGFPWTKSVRPVASGVLSVIAPLDGEQVLCQDSVERFRDSYSLMSWNGGIKWEQQGCSFGTLTDRYVIGLMGSDGLNKHVELVALHRNSGRLAARYGLPGTYAVRHVGGDDLLAFTENEVRRLSVR